MSNETDVVRIFQDLESIRFLRIGLIVFAAWGLRRSVSWLLPRLADRLPPRFRSYVLPSTAVIRLVILFAAIGMIVPLVIKPTLQNLVAILGAVGLAVGFAFKDYMGSLIAGVVAVYERPYRLGDWVEIEGTYGEVRSIGLRTVKIVTPDDTAVQIPHSKIWNSLVKNANDGDRTLMCVADFHLEPNHDGAQVRQRLREVALTSPYVELDRPVLVVLSEKPWGSHYRLKAYPVVAGDQFLFISDLTVRAKEALSALGVGWAEAVPAAERGDPG